MSRILSIGIGLLFSTFLLNAQGIVFSTHVPESKMGTEERIQIRYVIENAESMRNFELTESRDFKLIGVPASARNISMMNGEIKISISITAVFEPLRTGKLTFPSVIADVKGTRIQSNKQSIDVVKGSLARQRRRQRQQRSPFPQQQDPFAEIRKMQQQMMQQRRKMEEAYRDERRQQQPQQQRTVQPQRPQRKRSVITENNINDYLFIRVQTDKEKVVLGEQITVSYKLYADPRVSAVVGIPKLPDLNNFWSQEFENSIRPKPTREVYNGVEYQVITIRKTALFPTKTGKLVLDPAYAEGTAHIPVIKKVKARNPFSDFFKDDPFFGSMFDDNSFEDSYYEHSEMEEIPVKLKSKPVIITVAPTPEENKPEAFNGAVGNFSMESKISAAEISTDDIATLTLTIRGTGNIKLVDPPKLSLPSTVEVFDIIETDTITSKKNNKITGYKVIKYRFTPQATGELHIPAMELSYYNADAERYETKKTPEYSIQVKPGKAKKGNHILPMDIHDIAAEHTKLNREKVTELPEQIWYWASYLVPTAGLLFLLAFRRKEESERKDNVRYKNKRANKVALKRLERAEKHRQADEKVKFYEESSKAVWLYLSDKLNIPLANLSKEMAGTLLRKREISQDIIDELFLITDECEIALYAPESGDFKMNQIYSDSLKVLGTLEGKLG